jgi:hypothetical protein
MSKKIVIESCSECPFLIHNNYLAEFYESYYCKKSSKNANKKKLNREFDYFPNWCKLQDETGD